MLNIPAVSPSIVLVVSITGTNATTEAIVEVLYELTILILGMEKLGLMIPNIAIVVTELQIFLL